VAVFFGGSRCVASIADGFAQADERIEPARRRRIAKRRDEKKPAIGIASGWLFTTSLSAT
jgi:hypothetical protein